MNPEEQLNRYFDGALTEEERAILSEALQHNPELRGRLADIGEMADLHRESFPEEKDSFFIEQQFQEIQRQLEPEVKPRENLIAFPGRWLISTVGIAAAVLFTVTSLLMWNHTGGDAYDDLSNVDFVETDIEGANPMVFVDEQSGWTFVWLDVPENTATDEIAG